MPNANAKCYTYMHATVAVAVATLQLLCTSLALLATSNIPLVIAVVISLGVLSSRRIELQVVSSLVNLPFLLSPTSCPSPCEAVGVGLFTNR